MIFLKLTTPACLMSWGVLFNIQFGAPQSCYQMLPDEGLEGWTTDPWQYNQLIILFNSTGTFKCYRRGNYM